MFKKKLIISFLIFLVFCVNGKTVLAANNTEKPDNIKIKSSGKSLEDFIPKDWKIISKVQGDLNKDKRKDYAVVIEYAGVYTDADTIVSGQPRIFFVIFKQKDGTYKLSVQSNNLIMRSGEGGIYGDPFEGIEYSRGSVVVSLYGGSSWRWGYIFRFRYQDKDWYLIGETDLSGYTITGESATVDTNCLTGDQITTTIDKNGKKKVVTKKIEIKKLEKLSDFSKDR
ncbi:hypothetical protein QA584_16505 [Anaerocolumna sp. AGMB13025]|uniref:hypothetical protein n=1 Tax=Anaerocolumna sp. AGMB13025 TaxID=3039116 RepID=UPI00241E8090|nr:hypothetical protein [Anaerocolumna sp. AGMB13025]WFR55204.1 hypothetical protein QA584_16505 [Anaerocolumna sp. AGMB13025]